MSATVNQDDTSAYLFFGTVCGAVYKRLCNKLCASDLAEDLSTSYVAPVVVSIGKSKAKFRGEAFVLQHDDHSLAPSTFAFNF